MVTLYVDEELRVFWVALLLRGAGQSLRCALLLHAAAAWAPVAGPLAAVEDGQHREAVLTYARGQHPLRRAGLSCAGSLELARVWLATAFTTSHITTGTTQQKSAGSKGTPQVFSTQLQVVEHAPYAVTLREPSVACHKLADSGEGQHQGGQIITDDITAMLNPNLTPTDCCQMMGLGRSFNGHGGASPCVCS